MRKDGSAVNPPAAKVISKLEEITHDPSSSFLGTGHWRNDDLAKIKGPERGIRVRCIEKAIMVKDEGASLSKDPQLPLLMARLIELQEKVNAMKSSIEKQEAEIKDIKENQHAMIRVMDQLPIRFMAMQEARSLIEIFDKFSMKYANDSKEHQLVEKLKQVSVGKLPNGFCLGADALLDPSPSPNLRK